ncbi:tetratricopeptide repeat protein [uncultured Lacinutrix sp.]|uniref:tetratricopeptide repeat protein n=1 Tax=uncultured Lacinutrix sp. TaxID=574032 RepID=UPI002629E7DB|nr:tetratricopeptide repeat protein [uncultured Lacinutrix sp.]
MIKNKQKLTLLLISVFLIVSSCGNKNNKKPEHVLTINDVNFGISESGYQDYLDSLLVIKPDSAYLWQQKSMFLYKARKYNLGKPFLKKAAFHDPEKYLDYSAFMKCIFSKEYKESITEFMEYKERFGDSYVMDHTYNFYIALNYLQLNKFKKAKAFLVKSKEQQFNDFPKDAPEEACHFLDWFYLGVADYELGNFNEAIESFNMSLKVYANFADAMFYKAKCLQRLNKKEEANTLFEEAKNNKQSTIIEANSYYEIYPYQVFHKQRVAN